MKHFTLKFFFSMVMVLFGFQIHSQQLEIMEQ